MNTILKIGKHELYDVFRGKWVIVYTLFFWIITDSLFRFGGDPGRVILSLTNLVLIVIPLVSMIFGSLYLYNSREFIELLLSQPIDRRYLFMGMFGGIAIPVGFGFVIGAGLPFLYFGGRAAGDLFTLILLLAAGFLLTLSFLALSFFISVRIEDRLKGFGLAFLLWLFFTVIYDGLVLIFVYAFGDYPLERVMIILSMLNPVDLVRIALLMELDAAVMMGYTGAVFQKFFGSLAGMLITLGSMLVWILLPFYLGLRSFVKKDF
jgi:Cu-processing system permease protein